MKINKKKSVIESFLVVGMLMILACPLISASNFGVASLYSRASPLEVLPGEEVSTYFEIQNTLGEAEAINIEGTLTEGEEIAQLIGGPTYNVAVNGQTQVEVKIVIPVGAELGDEYSVKALFSSVEEDGEISGTGAGLSFNVEKAFTVSVVSEKGVETTPETTGETSTIWYWIIAIVIVIVVIWFVVKKKKQA